MKKCLLALLLAATTLLSSSCMLIEDMRTAIADLKFLTSNGRVLGYTKDGAIDYEYDEEAETRINERFQKLDEVIADNKASRTGTLTNLFGQQIQDLYYVSDHANLAFIDFCNDPTDEEASEKYAHLTEFGSEASAKLYRLYGVIYDSEYKDRFYEDWDQDEIDEALHLSEMYSDKFVEFSNKNDGYIREYQQLDQSSRSFMQDSAEKYYQIVQNNIETAKEAGFDSYTDYAYKWVYSRDYTKEDAQKLCKYVGSYLVPLYKELREKVASYKKLSEINEIISQLSETNIDSDTLKTKLTPYYTALGGESLEAFNNFTENYTSVSDSRAMPTAYTFFMNYYGQPVCYFGPDYQSLMTYVHEQGHYGAFYKSQTSIESIDLCEVHSQGNEWLYFAYIEDKYDAETYSYIIADSMRRDLLMIIMSICCDAFEQYVYAHPELAAKDYDVAFINCAKELGAYELLRKEMNYNPEYYWHYAIISNSLYYLSYAISLVPSIELHVIAREDGMEKAAEIYNKIGKVEYDCEFIETLTENGLTSPFEEEIYKKMMKHFTK